MKLQYAYPMIVSLDLTFIFDIVFDVHWFFINDFTALK